MTQLTFRLTLTLGLLLLLLSSSSAALWDSTQRMREFSREVEFDFTEWTAQALFQKASFAALRAEKFLNADQQNLLLQTYLEQVGATAQWSAQLDQAVSQPKLANRAAVIASTRQELTRAKIRLAQLSPLTESVVQSRTESLLLELGFGLGGQVLPPVLYQVTDLPLNLIVSPREEIRTLFSTNLIAGLDTLQKEAIESGIYEKYKVSALVEPIGGLGAYPTMVMRTTDFNWLTETVAHEWIHNYLSFTPLGMRYDASAQMRTINETVASLVGKEISRQMIARDFPQYTLPLPGPRMRSRLPEESQEDAGAFNFRAEMRTTRVRVDELLAEGKVDEAEAYMEARRQFFWEQGYQLRKLNQAYFAFYGSYNDQPGGGASGSDPVGPLVRRLWARSPDLKSFIAAVRGVRSFEDLQGVLAEQP
ncbi:MAG TPA: hypothetical protein PKW57_03635 [Anaerolineaceae bacterium]|nr:hypothetical protein [Anaerolineaceae bacterium]HPS32572.1 hypothetical protein [Anaerolineaceae bacterium]